MDKTTWQFVNSFAEWFSALGTIAAVVVALRLARRQYAPRLSVSFSGYIVADGSGETSEYYGLRVVNSGQVDVEIAGLNWRFSIRDRKRLIVVPPRNDVSSLVPTRLRYGEKAMYLYTPEQFEHGIRELRKAVPSWLLWRPFRRWLQFGVYTTVGAEFWASSDKTIVNMIRSKG